MKLLTQDFEIIPKSVVDRIELETRGVFAKWQERSGMSSLPEYRQDRMCLVWAMAGMSSVKRHVPQSTVMFQAGSCFWPITLPEHDDGVSPNRFGYLFDPVAAAINLSRGELPEIHAWFVVKVDNKVVIVDFASGAFRRIGCEHLGIEQKHSYEIPEHFWHNADDALPEGVEYVADRVACEIGFKYAQEAVLLAR